MSLSKNKIPRDRGILIDINYTSEPEFKPSTKLKNGKYLIGRMIHITNQCDPDTSRPFRREIAAYIVAEELQSDWIQKNVYPKNKQDIQKSIVSIYNQYRDFKKYLKLARCSESTKDKAATFNKQMTDNAFNIRTKCPQFQRKLEDEHGVKMTQDDEAFFIDNCFGSYTFTCSGKVDKKWEKQKNRVQKRLESASSTSKQFTQDLTQDEDFVENDSYPETEAEDDKEFDDKFRKYKPMSTSSNILTRSSKTTSENTKNQTGAIPKIKIKTSSKYLNENVMRCAVECYSKYKVSANDLAGIMVDTSNIVYEQQWVRGQLSSDNETSSEDEMQSPNEKKRRRKKDNNPYRFPSRRTLNKWLEDASYLNLKSAGEHIFNKQDSTVTIGLDDTTKAAGHKTFDVKADHITIHGPSQEKKLFTTGFIENKSHEGKISAETYEYKLKCMAVLCNSSLDEIKEYIDFWMTDRASDCSTMLDNMSIEDDKKIKCSAHIILGIDNAADKIFKNTEEKIGIQKLMTVSAGDKIYNKSSSIHKLGQIALTKLLSPSHANHSVSLYSAFTSWLEEKEKKPHTFKGFKSNRFGRVAEIDKEFLLLRDLIIEFFEACIDTNSNKLVLAVSAFLESDWFQICCQVYAEVGDLLVFPLMDLLGIDRKKDTHKTTWKDVQNFFQIKLKEIESKIAALSDTKGRSALMKSVLEEILITINRQLNEMNLFTKPEDCIQDEVKRLEFAPVTNSGCESAFATLDNKLKVSGGSCLLETLSRKNIVSTNKCLEEDQFTTLSEDERMLQWKWARNSKEVLEVKEMQKDFVATVKLSKQLAVRKKETLKQKLVEKTHKFLDMCKKHGGPVTQSSLNTLNGLKESELLAEIGYLRCTTHPNIRQRRQVRVDGKIRYEKLTVEELRTNIRNTIKPDYEKIISVESLIDAM